MGDRVKCLSIVQLSSCHILFTEFLNKIYEEQFKNELISLIPNLTKLTLSPHDYQKFHTSNGTWFCSIDSTKTAVLILTSSSYPIASTVRLQKEVLGEIQKIPRYFDPQTINLKEICKTNFYNLLKNYDTNPEYNDNMGETQKNVEQIQVQMEKNIKKMVDNTDQLKNVGHKTHKMNEMATRFKDKAWEIKNNMWKEKHRQTLVIVGILVTIIIIFFFMIRSIT